jgi:hypothetical protein
MNCCNKKPGITIMMVILGFIYIYSSTRKTFLFSGIKLITLVFYLPIFLSQTVANTLAGKLSKATAGGTAVIVNSLAVMLVGFSYLHI